MPPLPAATSRDHHTARLQVSAERAAPGLRSALNPRHPGEAPNPAERRTAWRRRCPIGRSAYGPLDRNPMHGQRQKRTLHPVTHPFETMPVPIAWLIPPLEIRAPLEQSPSVSISEKVEPGPLVAPGVCTVTLMVLAYAIPGTVTASRAPSSSAFRTIFSHQCYPSLRRDILPYMRVSIPGDTVACGLIGQVQQLARGQKPTPQQVTKRAPQPSKRITQQGLLIANVSRIRAVRGSTAKEPASLTHVGLRQPLLRLLGQSCSLLGSSVDSWTPVSIVMARLHRTHISKPSQESGSHHVAGSAWLSCSAWAWRWVDAAPGTSRRSQSPPRVLIRWRGWACSAKVSVR
jgi:hypothetical protein